MSTLVAVAEGLARYLGWWARALVRWRDPRAPMRPRRLLVLLAGFPVFFAIQLIHALCLLLDECLFRGYRRSSLDGTVVITGIPRSGTTFVHRTLARDTHRYTTIATWEAVLAPSICQRRLVDGLSWIDRRLGGPAARGLAALTRRLAGGMDDIHEIGLEAPEEDYLLLLPAGGCFIMLLAFPAAPGLRALARMDRDMPEGRRHRLLRFYRGCLQRHMYVRGRGRCLLSKNAAFGSWLGGLRETVPEARFIVCLRDPVQALGSQIRATAAARAVFGTETTSLAFQREFLDMYTYTLTRLADLVASWPVERAAVLDTSDLRERPAGSIRQILQRLAITEDDAMAARLAGMSASGIPHRPNVEALALDQATLEQQMAPPYERLLALPHRVGVAA